ncbi:MULTISPECIES: fructosamine kinase family protein [Niastella]|uniref:Fructosamine kinase family protein n=1 Tax=Niastella soli TaxID=2821487 RepID=A0ABS3YZR3_9BACT|nr:fructosamine kinase family protein [Niastella soli]MBO9203319.1 fructosamine kinase family protein [Niastella soli]
MITAAVQSFIQTLLNTTTSLQFTPVGGGSINHTYRITAGKETFFCKINQLCTIPALFETERQGLELLAQQQVIRIPQVIASGQSADHQVLILEWIDQGLQSDVFWTHFGEQLAALHHIQGKQFGLATDNYMGALHQSNQPTDSWTDFFIQQRIAPQVKLAIDRQLLEPVHVHQFEKLYQQLGNLFTPEPAVLLHGDLWSGNFLCDASENPVLIDPAVYYGHRSIDMAMTSLFGGFDSLFYESYNYHYPLPVNYRQQWEVCNLYPLLIHLNLFGKSYLADILHTIRRY